MKEQDIKYLYSPSYQKLKIICELDRDVVYGSVSDDKDWVYIGTTQINKLERLKRLFKHIFKL